MIIRLSLLALFNSITPTRKAQKERNSKIGNPCIRSILKIYPTFIISKKSTGFTIFISRKGFKTSKS